MEAHLVLSLANYPVISFGTGSAVRLPGPSIDKPNIYAFNSTTYDEIFHELRQKDQRLYTANGLLGMLDRNRKIKGRPERWQDWKPGVPRLQGNGAIGPRAGKDIEEGIVDVVITCEERCWDAVVEDLMNRDKGMGLGKSVWVVNVDIRDNHEEAIVGGRAILELANMLTKAAREERDAGGSFDERFPDVIAEWQAKFPGLPSLWTVAYF
jgi:RNA polymerase II subunit A C-terminal domain phosphatase SSU72